MGQLVHYNSTGNYDLQVQCLLRVWSNISTGEAHQEPFCTSIWDNVYCWPPTPPGQIIRRSCSEIFQESYSQFAAKLKGNVVRECLPNGTWAQGNSSDYNECAESFQGYVSGIDEDNFLIPMAHHMLFFGSILSLLCLGASLAIFFHFRCLWCDRVAVHLQLILSLVFRFVLMFIIAEPFVIGHSSSYRDVEIFCKAVLVLHSYFTFSSVSWMFVQGLFLNIALVKGVSMVCTGYQFAIYHMIGWGLPAIFVGAHAIVMVLRNQETCWKGYSDMDEKWILNGPMTIELFINGIFLINILRILLKKIRSSNSGSDTSQFKATAKAIAILFPVLGISSLVDLLNPGGNYNKYFMFLKYFFGSTQGIFVSIVFCFTDKEVRAAIRRAMDRRNARRIGNPTCAQNSFSVSFLKLFRRRVNTQNTDIILEHAI